MRPLETWPLLGASVWLYERDCRAREREAASLSLDVGSTTETLEIAGPLATDPM